MSHLGVLNAPMVTQFALMLIGLPPLLVWPLAKLRHRLDPDGRDFRIWGLALLFVAIPSVGPVVLALTMTPALAENLWPMRMWIISILALFGALSALPVRSASGQEMQRSRLVPSPGTATVHLDAPRRPESPLQPHTLCRERERVQL